MQVVDEMTGFSFSKVFNPQPGWYAGDFHLHSDASHDGENSPTELADLARKEGLDFLALTDHNTIDGFTEIAENSDFPFIPGIEVTLSKGHFNVFGMGVWRPWMAEINISQRAILLPEKYQSVSELMGVISQEGYINSINHPLLHPWEWLYKKTDLNYVHCVELWNDLYWPDNAIANPKMVELWTSWLNNGVRVLAIGGSDYHYPPKPDLGLFGERLGQPTTYVYAEELSVTGILDGVRRGKAYVSRGPKVDFQATTGSGTFAIGDDMGEHSGEIWFTISLSNQKDNAEVQLVRNGEVVASAQLGREGKSCEFRYDGQRSITSWFRVDVIDNAGQALAITNPIFSNYRQIEGPNTWDGA